MIYTQFANRKSTPQNTPILGENQVKNSAGGYVFALDDFKRLERFLVLGCDSATYYSSAQKLTVENAQCVERCLSTDYKQAVDIIVDVSEAGRAPKNDPALFALAIAASHKDKDVRQYALSNLAVVARTGTHLFQFVGAVKTMRGWGRGLREAVARWYVHKEPSKLAYQIIKYQQREGWSHRDLLRLCHVVAPTSAHQTVLRYAVKGRERDLDAEGAVPDYAQLIWAWERAKTADEAETVRLIEKYRLPHECVLTEHKKSPRVWEALLPYMPIGALVRNLATMTSCGLLTPVSDATMCVRARLNALEVRGSRLHPLNILVAQRTYRSGKGMRGGNTWSPVQIIVDSLEGAFYDAFANVTPSGKRTMIALDVSGSMANGSVCGSPLTPREAAAAMALVTARTEERYLFLGFAGDLIHLDITARDTLQSAIDKTSRLPFGDTDCALPMVAAVANNHPYDNFVVYTDNETWAGRIHPRQALDAARQKFNLPCKLVVVGMTATEFTIANPNDGGMLDVVGFDAAAPQVIEGFLR